MGQAGSVWSPEEAATLLWGGHKKNVPKQQPSTTTYFGEEFANVPKYRMFEPPPSILLVFNVLGLEESKNEKL